MATLERPPHYDPISREAEMAAEAARSDEDQAALASGAETSDNDAINMRRVQALAFQGLKRVASLNPSVNASDIMHTVTARHSAGHNQTLRP